MFRSRTGLFKNVSCPDGSGCTLGNCIFSHSIANAETLPKRVIEARTRSSCAEGAESQPSERLTKKPRILAPETVNNAPASHSQRVRFVQILRDKLSEAGATEPDSRAVTLEADVARESSAAIYTGRIRTLVREISLKMHLTDSPAVRDRSEEWREKVPRLLASQVALRAEGFCVEIPEPIDLPEMVSCARCQLKVRRDRLEGECRFHLLRRQWVQNNTRKGGGLSATYPCCGEPESHGNGCEIRETHVYKLQDERQLATVEPFINTPESDQSRLWAAGIDCEMSYTSNGMEMVRLTVVDFDTGKLVLDRLVRPKGTVLDLNTRFSGVSDIEMGVTLDGVHFPTLSYEEARAALWEYVDADTIIVGHGLDNDLAVLRIIHSRILDTSLLFPAVRKRKWPLKDLCWKYLSRRIQSGEHDSKEDAVAAIDVVKCAVVNNILWDRGAQRT